jgi:hypothetical protein
MTVCNSRSIDSIMMIVANVFGNPTYTHNFSIVHFPPHLHLSSPYLAVLSLYPYVNSIPYFFIIEENTCSSANSRPIGRITFRLRNLPSVDGARIAKSCASVD